MANSYHIICLTEKWLNAGFYSSELFDQRYEVYRRDRSESESRAGGGVLIAVRAELNPTHIKSWSSSSEDIWVSISLNSRKKVHICCTYVPPGTNHISDLTSHLSMAEYISNAHSEDTVVLVGDYNLPHITWTLDSPDSLPAVGDFVRSSANTRFIDFLSLTGYRQYNCVKNSLNRILDYVVSSEGAITVDRSESQLVPPDPYHPPLLISMKCLVKKNEYLKNKQKEITLFNLGDYEKIKHKLSVRDWHHEFKNLNTEQCTTELYNTLNKIISEDIPIKRIKGDNTFPKWYSSPLINIIKEKAFYHRKWKKFKNPLDYQSFSLLRSRQKTMERECYNRYVNNVESNLKKNPKYLFSFIKNKRNTGTIPKSMIYEGRTCTDPKDICNSFNSFFTSVHIRSDSYTERRSVVREPAVNININNIALDSALVSRYVRAIDTTKGQGADSIPAIFLKKCSPEISIPLSIIFNKSITEGCFPYHWKKTQITPIFKSGGDQNSIKDYRPISKLPIMSKILEKIVIDQIGPIINSYITPGQHGFRTKKSVDSNLLEFSHVLMHSIHNGRQVDAVYTDFAKAFDKINHKTLIEKIERVGISGELLGWFGSYISNRYQAVVLRGHESDYAPIYSGVPQGSHLGPLLFLIYINDVEECLRHSKILLFADDAKIFKEIRNTEDCERLQSDLTALQKYCVENQLFLNIEKCNIITYTRNRKKINFNYNINDKILQHKSEIRDLGIVLDEELGFTKHYEHTVTRAFRTLGFIIRNTKSFKDPGTLTILFNSLVRSVLEFGCAVWNPCYITHIDAIERVQKKYVKQLNYRKRLHFDSYAHSLQYHKISPLETRRLIVDLCCLHKIINADIDSPYLLSVLPFYCPLRRQRARCLFYTEQSRTNYHLNSFVNRACRSFNKNCMNDPNLDPFSTDRNIFKKNLTKNVQNLNAMR
jgi:exonuclease III